MTFAIPAIGVTPPILPTPPVSATPSTSGAGATSGFSDVLSTAVNHVSALQSKADGLATQAAAGTLENPHDYLIAASEASLATQMTVAVRNKALDAFNEIMRMPL